MATAQGTYLPGRTLGHYRILEKLGQGGMGEVYLARDLTLERDVALKILPQEWSQSAERRKRLEREAKAVAALQHPNVVVVHSVEEAEGLVFITMEAVRGRKLSELIPRDGLDRKRWLELAIPIVDAVAAAHHAGVIHRDLKPDNVMVTDDGRVKVLDFGLARIESKAPLGSDLPTRSATVEGRILGTFAYMSPEQAQGKRVDSRTDLFSVGVVLYEMATGRRPFEGDNASAIVAAILKEDPLELSRLTPRFPDRVSRLVHRCLEKDPERRLPTAVELREELEAARSDAGRRLRRPIVRGIAAAALLAATGLTYFLAIRPSSPPPLEYRVRPVTGLAGLEWMASASPDGSFLAYAHPTEHGLDVFVVPMSGGDPIRITNDPADEILPRWSPDGSRIAFLSDRGQGAAVYLVPALGGAARKVADTNISYRTQIALASKALGSRPWSSDGRTILFSRASPEGVGDDGREIAIWSVDVSTGAEARVTTPPPGEYDRDAAWSFDGGTIAFTRIGPVSMGIWSIDGPLQEPRQLVIDGTQPAWLPDGEGLVFVSERSGFRNLWRLDVDTGRLRQLTSGPGGHEYPSVRGDGSILYNELDRRPNLFSLEIEGGRQEQVTFNTRLNYSPRWSPDGSQLVYASSQTGSYELWLLDPASGSERRLTDDPAGATNPDWSPDGREIVFVSYRDGADRLWIVNVESGAARLLSPEIVHYGSYLDPHPRWSPDGKTIAYATPEGSLATMDVSTSESRVLVPDSPYFDWYLDSRRVVYAKRRQDSSMDLLARDLETGKEVLLDSGHVAELSVARNGAAIVFCRGPSDPRQDAYVLPLTELAEDGLPRRAGEPRRLTNGEGRWHVHNPSWYPDGSSLIFARSPVEGDVYILEPSSLAR